MSLWMIVSFVCFLFGSTSCVSDNVEDYNIMYLTPGSIIDHRPNQNRFSGDLEIYCFLGNQKQLTNLFNTIKIILSTDKDDFDQYIGHTPGNVLKDYREKKTIFSFQFFRQRNKQLVLDAFNQTCVGIDATSPYRITLSLNQVDLKRVAFLVIGFLLFFSANTLSKNALFHYIVSIILGICLSFLILFYLVSKLFPKRPMMYGVMVGGWTISLYLISRFMENIQMILTTYQTFLIWYTIVVGIISFIVSYRMGPPQDPRSRNIIKWVLQLIALICDFFSSDLTEATIMIGVLMIICHYVPMGRLNFLSKTKLFKRKPKVKLLTNDEFQEQAAIETKKALEDLKRYCNSPDCKQWDVMLRLNNPRKFASFIEGGSHVDDDEMSEYDRSMLEISDDESNESNGSHSNGEDEYRHHNGNDEFKRRLQFD